MHKIMKEAAMDLLFENHFPIPGTVISEDPDYLDACDEITELSSKLKKELSEEQYHTVDGLLALTELANGYMLLEYFHKGLVSGYDLYEAVEHHPMRKEIIALIRQLFTVLFPFLSI